MQIGLRMTLVLKALKGTNLFEQESDKDHNEFEENSTDTESDCDSDN